jgi:hypothetical protein
LVIDRENKLDFFKELYAEAKAHAQGLHEAFDRNLEQYKGSKEIDDGEDALTVRNITYELIESQVSSYIPTPVVNPSVWSERNERNAKSVENLLKNLRDRLSYEKMNDLDERYNPIYGGSVWLAEWDNAIVTHNSVGDVKVTCTNPLQFTGQPGIWDVRDMEYCFIEFSTTTDDIVRQYGVSLKVAEATERSEEYADNTATIYVCYYRDEDGKVCQFIWSEDEVLSDIEDYYARKIKVCKKCGKREELCSCEKPELETLSEEEETIDHDIVLSDGTILPHRSEKIGKDGQVVTETVESAMTDQFGNPAYDNVDGILIPKTIQVEIPVYEDTKLPWYRPSLLPIVIRKNTSQEESVFGQSDCEFIRPQQQAINKLESRILEKLIKGGVFPLIPEDAIIELDNSVLEKAFRVKPGQIGMYNTLDLQANISQDIAQSDRLYDQAKRILGISDSFQGQYDGSAQSGIAKQMQIQQSAGRLDSKRKMKNAAYAELDEVIFQLYLAYADEPRPISYVDSFGRMQNAQFNRYDFIARDESGEYYYEDRYLFSADAAADAERDRIGLWQENRQNFQSGAYGNPQDLETLLIFWMNMEKAHYPYAHDNVERIRRRIEEQAQMQQLMMQNQQLQAQNQEQGQIIQAMNNPETIKAYANMLNGGQRQ